MGKPSGIVRPLLFQFRSQSRSVSHLDDARLSIISGCKHLPPLENQILANVESRRNSIYAVLVHGYRSNREHEVSEPIRILAQRCVRDQVPVADYFSAKNVINCSIR